jgi:hypothetical protein
MKMKKLFLIALMFFNASGIAFAESEEKFAYLADGETQSEIIISVQASTDLSTDVAVKFFETAYSDARGMSLEAFLQKYETRVYVDLLEKRAVLSSIHKNYNNFSNIEVVEVLQSEKNSFLLLNIPTKDGKTFSIGETVQCLGDSCSFYRGENLSFFVNSANFIREYALDSKPTNHEFYGMREGVKIYRSRNEIKNKVSEVLDTFPSFISHIEESLLNSTSKKREFKVVRWLSEGPVVVRTTEELYAWHILELGERIEILDVFSIEKDLVVVAKGEYDPDKFFLLLWDNVSKKFKEKTDSPVINEIILSTEFLSLLNEKFEEGFR